MSAPTAKKRSSFASCLACRAQHCACDEVRPCNRCSRLGIPCTEGISRKAKAKQPHYQLDTPSTSTLMNTPYTDLEKELFLDRPELHFQPASCPPAPQGTRMVPSTTTFLYTIPSSSPNSPSVAINISHPPSLQSPPSDISYSQPLQAQSPPPTYIPPMYMQAFALTPHPSITSLDLSQSSSASTITIPPAMSSPLEISPVSSTPLSNNPIPLSGVIYNTPTTTAPPTALTPPSPPSYHSPASLSPEQPESPPPQEPNSPPRQHPQAQQTQQLAQQAQQLAQQAQQLLPHQLQPVQAQQLQQPQQLQQLQQHIQLHLMQQRLMQPQKVSLLQSQGIPAPTQQQPTQAQQPTQQPQPTQVQQQQQQQTQAQQQPTQQPTQQPQQLTHQSHTSQQLMHLEQQVEDLKRELWLARQQKTNPFPFLSPVQPRSLAMSLWRLPEGDLVDFSAGFHAMLAFNVYDHITFDLISPKELKQERANLWAYFAREKPALSGIVTKKPLVNGRGERIVPLSTCSLLYFGNSTLLQCTFWLN